MKAIFALIFMLISSAAQAVEIPRCQCTERDLDIRVSAATAIFTGTVLKIEPTDEFKRAPKADPAVIVTLKVGTAYKGVKPDQKEFTLHTSLTDYTCTGHPFVVGKDYLVYAYYRKDFSADFTALYRYPPGTYDVGGLCGGTKLVEKAGDDLSHLTVQPEEKGRLEKLFNK